MWLTSHFCRTVLASGSEGPREHAKEAPWGEDCGTCWRSRVLTPSTGSGRSIDLMVRPWVTGSFMGPTNTGALLRLGAHWAGLGSTGLKCSPERSLPPGSSAQDGEPGPSTGPEPDKLAPSHMHMKKQLNERQVSGNGHPWSHKKPEALLPLSQGLTGKGWHLPPEIPKLVVCPGVSGFAV